MINSIFSTLSSMTQVKSDLKAVLKYIADFQKIPLILPILKVIWLAKKSPGKRLFEKITVRPLEGWMRSLKLSWNLYLRKEVVIVLGEGLLREAQSYLESAYRYQWCAREDLNLHTLSGTGPSDRPVYQFQHADSWCVI